MLNLTKLSVQELENENELMKISQTCIGKVPEKTYSLFEEQIDEKDVESRDKSERRSSRNIDVLVKEKTFRFRHFTSTGRRRSMINRIINIHFIVENLEIEKQNSLSKENFVFFLMKTNSGCVII